MLRKWYRNGESLPEGLRAKQKRKALARSVELPVCKMRGLTISHIVSRHHRSFPDGSLLLRRGIILGEDLP
jgi:hypothetical protein